MVNYQLVDPHLDLYILQGVRRVVALTGAEARDAVTHAKELTQKLRELDSLKGAELETQTTAFKIVNPFPLLCTSGWGIHPCLQKFCLEADKEQACTSQLISSILSSTFNREWKRIVFLSLWHPFDLAAHLTQGSIKLLGGIPKVIYMNNELIPVNLSKI